MRQRVINSPYCLMALQLVLWGSYAAVSKGVLGSLSVWSFQCYSFGIALIAYAIPYFANGGLVRLCGTGFKTLLALFLTAIPSFLYYYFYSTALSMTGAVEASVLNYTFPVFVLLLAWPINGEKLSPRGLGAIVLGVAGAFIVITGGGASFSGGTGVWFALVAAICWGLFSNVGKRIKADAETANFIYISVSFMLSLFPMLFTTGIQPVGGVDFVSLLWNGVFSIAAGYWVWFRMLAIAPSALVANLSFLTPFANLLFIALLLKEPIEWQHWLGLCLILLGVLLQAIPKKRNQYGTENNSSAA
jgi:drug/metabolite transporter (DMT)-like permease